MKIPILLSILLVFILPLFSFNEDFESGDFSHNDWEFNGDFNWEITSENSYEGTYCIRNEDIGDNQTASISINHDFDETGTLTFFWRVSSEVNYDYLKFYLDGAMMARISGTKAWDAISFYITEGNHTLEWTYEKDVNTTNGYDMGWIDLISFNSSETPYDNDLRLYSFECNRIFQENQIVDISLEVQNVGLLPLDNYLIGLYENDEMIDQFIVNDSISPGELQLFETEYTPEQINGIENIDLYAKILSNEDQNPLNDESPSKHVTFLSEEFSFVEVGVSEAYELNGSIPMTMTHDASLSEILILEESFNNIGYLKGVSLQYDFQDSVEETINMYVVQSDTPNLENDWAEIDSLNHVFAEDTMFDANRDWVDFMITDTLVFLENNLSIRFDKDFNDQLYSQGKNFKGSFVDYECSRYCFSDVIDIDPLNPLDGISSNFMPHMILFFKEYPFGNIEGTITSDADVILDSVLVTVNELQLQITSDENGFYNFIDLPDSIYSITFEKDGYVTQTIEDIDILPGHTIILDCVLETALGAEDDSETPGNEFKIYPNPFCIQKNSRSNLCLDMSSKSSDIIKIKLYDIKGKLVDELKNINVKRGKNQIGIPISDYRLNSGIYFIKVESESLSFTNKLVIIK